LKQILGFFALKRM